MRIILIMMTLVCMATSAWAATYYVSDGTGNDGNAGTAAAPYKTIAAAYARAGSGDTIIVKPGIYREYSRDRGIWLNKNGITLKSEVKWGAIIDGGNYSVISYDSYPRHAGFSVTGNNNTIDGFEIRYNHHTGVNVAGSYLTVINCHLHHNGYFGDPNTSFGHGAFFSWGFTKGGRYIGNYLHDNGRPKCKGFSYCNLDHGFYQGGDDEIIANNIITHHPAEGIQEAGYYSSSNPNGRSNSRILNNVIAYNGKMPWQAGIMIWNMNNNLVIKNNIIFNNTGWAIATYNAWGTGNVIDKNIVFGNTRGTFDLPGITVSLGNNPNVDPLFWNPTGGDFGLKLLSPALDTGLTLPEVPQDFLGRPRPSGPAYDLGVFEGSGSHPNPVPDVTGGGGGSGGSGGGGDPTSPPPCCVD